jgi:hypothetical protein
MKSFSPSYSQRGATLIIGLIMLAIIMVLVANAFTLSATNLKSVGNMQSHDEAIAAGRKAIGQVMESAFASSAADLAAAAGNLYVDINNDGVNDYVVAIATPVCMSKSVITSNSTSGTASSLSLGSAFNTTAVTNYNTVWDISATVSDLTATGAAGGSGTSVQMHEGLRKVLDQTTANLVCP